MGEQAAPSCSLGFLSGVGVSAASSHSQHVSEAAGIRMAKGSPVGPSQKSVAVARRGGFSDMPDVMAPALT